MTPPAFFTPDLFRFLRELNAHNDREWFQAHKERYESDVKGPLAAFCLALDPHLRKLSRSYGADPRTSLFRIQRDTRFSKDKSPYKPNAGAQFRHMDCPRDVHAPGFYLHLEPGGCFGGAGSWHPDAGALGRIRAHLATHEKAWKAVRKACPDIQGEALKRVPAGFPADHPLAEDLKLKDFYTLTGFTEAEVCAGDFLERYVENCRQGAPLMKFLATALELPW